jgi:hypothetical protein
MTAILNEHFHYGYQSWTINVYDKEGKFSHFWWFEKEKDALKKIKEFENYESS